jgi:hypothetical protein
VHVTMTDGSSVTAKRGVVVAVEGPEASRLLGDNLQVGFIGLPLWFSVRFGGYI